MAGILVGCVSGGETGSKGNGEVRVFNWGEYIDESIFADFTESSSKNKRLVLRMMQELARRDAVSVARILDELLQFPEETLEEIQELAGQD